MSKQTKKKQGSEKAPVNLSKIENEKQAEELAKTYIPKEVEKEIILVDGKEISVNPYDVMYVTTDKNVFFKAHAGEARSHAKKINGKVFEVKL